ncbi:MAG: energy transducer TonB [Balneolales bacterium]|nr:energy transducer TonB [Balneolales bacterium]
MNTSIIDLILKESHYQHRVMGSIIVSQLLLIAIFRFWPVSEVLKEPEIVFDRQAIIVQEMIITKQANAPASPPKPQTPIPVPNDEVIDEIIDFPEFEDLITFDLLSLENSTGQMGDEERISGNPDRIPRILRIVEPILSEEAKKSDVKALVYVNFLVGSRGDVKEAYIAEIRLYDKNGEEYEVVKSIGYGILEATLEAAYKWRFRPAMEDGEQVGAYIQEAFSFGF